MSVEFFVLDLVFGIYPLAIDFLTGDIYNPKLHVVHYFLEVDKTTKSK